MKIYIDAEKAEENLKPCPFCGGHVKIEDCTDRAYGFWDYRIVCECGCKFVSPSTAKGEWIDKSYKQTRNDNTKKYAYEEMIKRWNRRMNNDD